MPMTIVAAGPTSPSDSSNALLAASVSSLRSNEHPNSGDIFPTATQLLNGPDYLVRITVPCVTSHPFDGLINPPLL